MRTLATTSCGPKCCIADERAAEQRLTRRIDRTQNVALHRPQQRRTRRLGSQIGARPRYQRLHELSMKQAGVRAEPLKAIVLLAK
jgi:hypothetical protein